MNIGNIFKNKSKEQKNTSPVRSVTFKERHKTDIYFTDNFYAKAKEWNLTEAYARFVFIEGDVVKQNGKPTNMKVATYKGEEIGIYVFHDRDTDQPVITSIWKRKSSSSKR